MVARHTFLKLCRFGIAGGASTLLYALFAFILSSIFSIKFIYIHLTAFFMAIPFSYLMQRGFTFRHKGSHKKTSWRFLITTLAALGVSSLTSFYLVDIADAPEWIGIATVMLIVPLTSYAAMSYWVFRDKK
jgi:putative flippase GtrA